MIQWETGTDSERKYFGQRGVKYTEIDNKVWGWFCDVRAKDIPVSGKLIQEKVLLISVELDYDGFSASNGWLESWQKRYDVKFSVLCG